MLHVAKLLAALLTTVYARVVAKSSTCSHGVCVWCVCVPTIGVKVLAKWTTGAYLLDKSACHTKATCSIDGFVTDFWPYLELNVRVKYHVMKVSLKKAAQIGAALGHKKRARGKAFPKGQQPWTFKPGQSGNPGGKPRVHLKFKAKIAEKMLEPAPPEVIKALKLKRNATVYDAMITAFLFNAMSGDNVAFMNAHDIVDGPVVQKRVSLTAAAEKFLTDPGFRQFLEEAHGEFLQSQGVTYNGTGQPRVSASSSLHRLLRPEGTEES